MTLNSNKNKLHFANSNIIGYILFLRIPKRVFRFGQFIFGGNKEYERKQQ